MFKLKFTSYEGDGDFYEDTHLIVPKKVDADFLTTLAGYFNSTNSKGRGYGNTEHGDDRLLGLIKYVLKSFDGVSQEIQDMLLDEDVVYENLCVYMLSDSVERDYGFCRVVSGISSKEIVKGAILHEKGSLNDLIFVQVLENGAIQCREAKHPLKDGAPDIHKLEWVLKEVALNDLNFEYCGEPTEASRLVANL